MEIWKEIPGYEGFYEVSDLGRVKRIGRSRGTRPGWILAPAKSHGYRSVRLSKNDVQQTHFIHRLVLATFLGENFGNANHINGDRADNRLCNLEGVNQTANRNHSLYVLKEKRRIDASIARQIRDAAANGSTRSNLRQDFGLPRHVIDDVLGGRCWKLA